MLALNVASATGARLSLRRPHHFNISTHERGELKTFLFLIQLDDWQAVDAENGGDFAAVMDVMFEHTPDDLLARNGGYHFSRRSPRDQPPLGGSVEGRVRTLRRGQPLPPVPRAGGASPSPS